MKYGEKEGGGGKFLCQVRELGEMESMVLITVSLSTHPLAAQKGSWINGFTSGGSTQSGGLRTMRASLRVLVWLCSGLCKTAFLFSLPLTSVLFHFLCFARKKLWKCLPGEMILCIVVNGLAAAWTKRKKKQNKNPK